MEEQLPIRQGMFGGEPEETFPAIPGSHERLWHAAFDLIAHGTLTSDGFFVPVEYVNALRQEIDAKKL